MLFGGKTGFGKAKKNKNGAECGIFVKKEGECETRTPAPPPLLPGPFYLVFICLGMEIHEHEFETKGSKTLNNAH